MISRVGEDASEPTRAVRQAVTYIVGSLIGAHVS
jgi:hypothetical protein